MEVIRNLSVSIAKGETVAIVGPSGGGKSTLFRLLLGFNSPRLTAFLCWEDQQATRIRELFAFVPQEPYLFSGTIRDNIAHGHLTASDADIKAAATQANAHDFIEYRGG